MIFILENIHNFNEEFKYLLNIFNSLNLITIIYKYIRRLYDKIMLKFLFPIHLI